LEEDRKRRGKNVPSCPGYRSKRHRVELRQRVEEEIDHLKPRLEELAEGEVEVISVDEKTGTVTLRIFGGRLH